MSRALPRCPKCKKRAIFRPAGGEKEPIKKSGRPRWGKLHKRVSLSSSASILPLSGVLTPDIFCLDECFHAAGSLEIDEIVRRSGSMKPTDNEIWPGFYKDEIRSASRPSPRRLSDLSGSEALCGGRRVRVAAAVHTNKADGTRDHFRMMDHKL